MNTSGVSGNQSTKDIFAHLEAQNKVLVIWMDEAQIGRVYIDSLFDQPDLNGRYAVVDEANKDRSTAMVVTTFRQTLDELEACIELLINEELANAELTAWFVIPRWKRKENYGSGLLMILMNISNNNYPTSNVGLSNTVLSTNKNIPPNNACTRTAGSSQPNWLFHGFWLPPFRGRVHVPPAISYANCQTVLF